MKVNDLRESNSKEMSFRSLDIGQGYADGDGNICIKTSKRSSNGLDNCIYWDNAAKQWFCAQEDEEEIVFPIKTELQILP